MAKEKVHPTRRPMLWRKVQVRLAALGMTQFHLTLRLWPEVEFARGNDRRLFSKRLSWWLASPSAVTPEYRERLEDALELPRGALLDVVPLHAVGAVPVPPAYEPDDECGAQGLEGDAPPSVVVLLRAAVDTAQAAVRIGPHVGRGTPDDLGLWPT